MEALGVGWVGDARPCPSHGIKPAEANRAYQEPPPPPPPPPPEDPPPPEESEPPHLKPLNPEIAGGDAARTAAEDLEKRWRWEPNRSGA